MVMPSKKKRLAPTLEMLESRQLLSTSVWTGAAGDQLYTDGANWQGGVAPAPGNDLVFNALTTPQTVNVNAASIAGNISISGRYTFTNQQLTVNGNVESNTSATAVFTNPLAVANGIHFTADASATLTLGTINDNSSETLDKYGTGILLLAGNSNSTWQLLDGTMTVETTTAINVNQFAGTLNGAGVVRSISDNGATVSPGSAHPETTLTATSNTFFNSGTLAITLDGTGSYSSLTANAGAIDLTNNPTLSLSLGSNFSTRAGQTYDILRNNSGVAIVGTFANLPEAARVDLGGEIFSISYAAGSTGHDVVLTTVGASSVVTLQSSVTTGLINESVTLTATVTGLNNTPTGRVTFIDNGAVLGSAALNDLGVATFTTTKLPNGSNTIHATYAGDTNLAAGTSNSILVNLGRVGPAITRGAAAVLLTAKAATLSVVATDTTSALISSLTYTWSVVKMPSGAATPLFSVNGDRSSRTTTVSFTKDGTYHFRVTITNSAGRSVTSDVDYFVRQYARSLRITPHGATVAKEGTIQFKTVALDQFAHPLRVGGVASYAIFDGDGSINAATGVYTAGRQAGPVTIESTLGALTGIIVTTIA